ncbi:diacylglycerol kinase family protein [Salinimicrobium sp. MT39]|uniref:Diacylglycerol kinase family protein n=1 Tax=Salinimicrobium profundisediminis TaxID=2994553 RepID=A0A9X3CZN4_9FLAO|nr:diacylglycerol kinase family protein [Salinimicrobium profundisediminis]MCX2839639.1 diacylglycerol kinase family protein [Salinimicrobium profundisediminis]
MKKAILIHNPTAGNGNHEKDSLVKQAEKVGFEVSYFSTSDPFMKRFTKEQADVIFVAGGDGTVQKFAACMLEAKESIKQVPVQVLPYGTANNIATTLGIKVPEEGITAQNTKTGFDIGIVEGVEEAGFFIESIGCGIFPKLVREMKALDDDEKQDEIKKSRETLVKVIDFYEAREAIIIAGDKEITGKFLLIELMNIRYIGPNIELAPNAETGDGYFELITVREERREELKSYIEDHLNEKNTAKKLEDFADLLKVKSLRLKWIGKDVHIDDEIIEDYREEEIKVNNRKGFFTFLTP